jgi:hypothetical protein
LDPAISCKTASVECRKMREMLTNTTSHRRLACNGSGISSVYSTLACARKIMFLLPSKPSQAFTRKIDPWTSIGPPTPSSYQVPCETPLHPTASPPCIRYLRYSLPVHIFSNTYTHYLILKDHRRHGWWWMSTDLQKPTSSRASPPSTTQCSTERQKPRPRRRQSPFPSPLPRHGQRLP